MRGVVRPEVQWVPVDIEVLDHWAWQPYTSYTVANEWSYFIQEHSEPILYPVRRNRRRRCEGAGQNAPGCRSRKPGIEGTVEGTGSEAKRAPAGLNPRIAPAVLRSLQTAEAQMRGASAAGRSKGTGGNLGFATCSAEREGGE